MNDNSGRNHTRMMLSLFVTILCLGHIYGQGYGPYYYPRGADTDPIFITFGEFNTTHFYINVFITGDHWFGFAFASGSGCTLSSVTCNMVNSDAIIFGLYGGADPLTAKEYKLGTHEAGSIHTSQDIGIQVLSQYNSQLGIYEYSANIRRPYDPSKHGDTDSYKITYPLAGDFCWLWAQGTDISLSNVSTASHGQNKGHQCIQFGGITNDPTPSPSYGPTPGPTNDPTPKPSKQPSVVGDTSTPSSDPSKEPTISPTDITNLPSTNPTSSPTPGPTVELGTPTKSPTKKPTQSPTKEPTSDPTIRPTPPNGITRHPTPKPSKQPSVVGDTSAPSSDPSKEPTDITNLPSTHRTYEPTNVPTKEPTEYPSAAPTKCSQDLSLTNEGCTDDRCADSEDPYLDIILSFSVCKKKPFVGRRYGLWNVVVNCLCYLSKNGNSFDYSNPVTPVTRRRLGRGDNKCNLNVLQYNMDVLIVPVSTNCNTTGFRFFFAIEGCADCVTLTKDLKKIKDMETNDVHNAVKKCTNWYAQQVDTIGFDGVYDVELSINDEFGSQCDITTNGVNNKCYNIFVVIIMILLLVIFI